MLAILMAVAALFTAAGEQARPVRKKKPVRSGGKKKAFVPLTATLGAVAAAGGTTVPAVLGEIPLTDTEQLWTVQRISITSPTLVTGVTATSGTFNIRQLRQNALATMPVSAGGSGYTSAPTVTVAPPRSDGQPLSVGQRVAQAHAVLTAGAVSSYVIDDPGAGYLAAPVITVLGGGGTGATCTSPTVGQVVVSTVGTLALITGVNLPAEAPVVVPITGTGLLMAGDALDVQYVQASTGLALPAGVNVKAELQ